MKRHAFTAVLVALLLGTALAGCGRSRRTFTDGTASDLLDAYFAAVAAGDSTGVCDFWSRESRDKPGFWHMHLSIGALAPFSEFRELVDTCTYEIMQVRSEDDYHVIDIVWIPRDTIADAGLVSRRRMRYYVVSEGSRFALINPLDVLTRDWQVYEGEYCVFHYPRSLSTRQHLFEMTEMDNAVRELAGVLGTEIPRKVDFYRPESAETVGELLLHPPGYGYASVHRNVIVSLSFLNPHEFIHLVTMPEGELFINAAFCEGICVALGGGTWFSPDYSLAQARNLIDSDMYMPLEKVMLGETAEFLRFGNITYHLAGAFVRFLLDEYGMAKLRELQAGAASSGDLLKTIAAVYGGAIADLELQWKEYLRNLDIPEVGGFIPGDAEVVFSMTDPAGDDVGDGDYVYPTDGRFTQGMFDLRKFEILKDTARAYFRIQMQTLSGPVVNYATGESFLAGPVIAITRGDSYRDRRQRECGNVTFEADAGYDIRLDVARNIVVTDNFGKACFPGPDIFDRITDRSRNVIEFSLPLDFIGEPDRDWRYFVGVCLMNDYALGFLRHGPEPINLQPDEFRFGGGDGAGFSPRYIDILLPETKDQARILGAYDPNSGKRAVVPMIGPDN